jgi:hypothetical protein
MLTEGDHASSYRAPRLLAPRKRILSRSLRIRTQDPAKRREGKRERERRKGKGKAGRGWEEIMTLAWDPPRESALRLCGLAAVESIVGFATSGQP